MPDQHLTPSHPNRNGPFTPGRGPLMDCGSSFSSSPCLSNGTPISGGTRSRRGSHPPTGGSHLLVAYYRVSTQKQGRSGLGLEAQQDGVHRFAEAHGLRVVNSYVEVETGKGADALELRPHLSGALDEARHLGAKVVVA